MITLKQIEGVYDVIAPDGHTVLGQVYRAPDQAWSYAPWVISGVHDNVKGGVNGKQERRKGWRTRDAAVREICIMNSAVLCRQVTQ